MLVRGMTPQPQTCAGHSTGSIFCNSLISDPSSHPTIPRAGTSQESVPEFCAFLSQDSPGTGPGWGRMGPAGHSSPTHTSHCSPWIPHHSAAPSLGAALVSLLGVLHLSAPPPCVALWGPVGSRPGTPSPTSPRSPGYLITHCFSRTLCPQGRLQVFLPFPHILVWDLGEKPKSERPTGPFRFQSCGTGPRLAPTCRGRRSRKREGK